jgi:hypothetical protein
MRNRTLARPGLNGSNRKDAQIMNEQDRQAIEGLFSRLAEAECRAGPRDAAAEAFIQQRIGDQPGAPYMMAQTIVVQNMALERAQARIAELERTSAESAPVNAQANGGILGGLFGGAQQRERPRHTGSVPVAGQRSSAPQAQPQQAGGGGFLAGAAQTAIGVAGGMMLGNMIGGMFSGGDTATAAPADAAADPEPDAGGDDSGGGFFDSIFGDGGDMEF